MNTIKQTRTPTRYYRPINPKIFTKSRPELIEEINNKARLVDLQFYSIDEILNHFYQKDYKRIKVLNLSGFENINKKSIQLLGKFTKLRHLFLTGCKIQNVIHDIEELDFLTHLDLENTDLTYLHGFPLPKLKWINLSGTKLENLNGLYPQINLHTLILKNCTELKDLNAISYLTGVRNLDIVGCPKISNLDCLANHRLKVLQTDFFNPHIERKYFSSLLLVEGQNYLNKNEEDLLEEPPKKRFKKNDGRLLEFHNEEEMTTPLPALTEVAIKKVAMSSQPISDKTAETNKRKRMS